MRPFGPNRHRSSKERFHQNKRRQKQFRLKRSAKLRESYGCAASKRFLRTSLLNVDGLNETTLEDVKSTITSQKPDLVFLLETNRRLEECHADIDIEGYSLHEALRSNVALDKEGGGIAMYTRQCDGLLFRLHTPDILDAAHTFVNSERIWVTVQSQTSKTAICGVYLGCQYGDDRHGAWNDALYQVLQQEAYDLRSKGYRVCYMGDFNGHVGCVPGQGVAGNSANINPNGRRFLDFLDRTDSVHVNGIDHLTKGLWTRQRGGVSSIIDFAVISREHLSSVISLEIDDKGELGGGSDHNWLVLDLADNFIRLKRVSNATTNKPGWNITEDQDWSSFSQEVKNNCQNIDYTDVNKCASSISATILAALHSKIGLKSSTRRKLPSRLPPDLVKELKIKRELEKNWKTLSSLDANLSTARVAAAESLFLDQKAHVSDLLLQHRHHKRASVIKQCSGNSIKARKSFWSHVSVKDKQKTEITAVIQPQTGAVKCGVDEIKTETEKHLIKVFEGSYERIPTNLPNAFPADHYYAQNPMESSSVLENDDSNTLETNPSSWINSEFKVPEISKMLSTLNNGKARGWDNIPNEALKNIPTEMIVAITKLFNLIKTTGTLPTGWNRGRVTLIHKRGLREILGNYRPITVNISLSGLYSKVLNERLTNVVEEHNLLGEIQNGFRKDRCAADNNFILDTILWKAKACNKKVHLAFIDISKAYDSVNRGILWSKLSSLGIGGDFLSCLKSLYTDDSIDCVVNGVLTKPIFLRRGLRQGCALSPLLFALYIRDVGSAITDSSLGFRVGNVCVSGLLFADDLVLVTRSGDSLKALLNIVKFKFDALKLQISHEKSQIVSPEDVTWNLRDMASSTEMSLQQVAQYKFLGTWTYGSMYRTTVEKQKVCVKTAAKYMNCCIYVSKMGPDVVDVVMCTWRNVAIPAILSGCEMIPFCDTRIQEIERYQSQVAKFALRVPKHFPNVSAQSELGLKSFKQLLYERQLKFFFRLLYLPPERWSHQALQDHFSGTWPSKYLQYIAQLRSEMGIYTATNIPSFWKPLSSSYFLGKCNQVLTNYPWVRQVDEKLSRARYVTENDMSAVITEFKFDHAGLGARIPRLGYKRKPYCPLCPVQRHSSCFHVLFECTSLSALRVSSGIQSFINSCRIKGISLNDSYDLFVNGEDSTGTNIPLLDYYERATCMDNMRKLWLSKW